MNIKTVIMTKEDFLKKGRAKEDWAPGWEAIEQEFERLYPGQEPSHYGTLLTSRAIFGGDQYLDGFSVYRSPKDFFHLLTFGMTQLYFDEEAYGGEWNKWGYEMTIKLKEASPDDCKWAIDMLANLARYTYTSERFFEPYQYVAGDGTSIHVGESSAITALITVPDTEAQTLDTVYGRTEFVQLVGITEPELQAVMKAPDRIRELCERMQQDNPDLVTNMKRTVSYIE